MEITRNYAHRTFGAIATARLSAEVGKVTLDGHTLPEASVEYLLNFALQCLQDAYAGAKDQGEAQALYAKRHANIVAGTMGSRGPSTAVDEETYVARMLIRPEYKRALGAKSPEWAAFTGLSDDEQAARLDAIYAKNRERMADAVAAEMERRAKAAKARAMLGGAMTFEL